MSFTDTMVSGSSMLLEADSRVDLQHFADTTELMQADKAEAVTNRNSRRQTLMQAPKRLK